MATPSTVDRLLDEASLQRLDALGVARGARRRIRVILHEAVGLARDLKHLDTYGLADDGPLAATILDLRETPAVRRARRAEAAEALEAAA